MRPTTPVSIQIALRKSGRLTRCGLPRNYSQMAGRLITSRHLLPVLLTYQIQQVNRPLPPIPMSHLQVFLVPPAWHVPKPWHFHPWNCQPFWQPTGGPLMHYKGTSYPRSPRRTCGMSPSCAITPGSPNTHSGGHSPIINLVQGLRCIQHRHGRSFWVA